MALGDPWWALVVLAGGVAGGCVAYVRAGRVAVQADDDVIHIENFWSKYEVLRTPRLAVRRHTFPVGIGRGLECAALADGVSTWPLHAVVLPSHGDLAARKLTEVAQALSLPSVG